MSNRALTILAGGTSRRFQNKEGQWSDKTLLNYNNKPLLVHLLEQSTKIYDRVGISVNTKKRKKVYSSVINSYSTISVPDYIVDEKGSCFEGVLKGICSSMKYFENHAIQFVPSDRPYLLFDLLRKLEVPDNGVSILQYSNGMIEPLLALYGPNLRVPTLFLTIPLSRADVPIRLASIVQTYNIEKLLEMNDLSPMIFTNINIQADLELVEKGENIVPRNIVLPNPETIEKSTQLNLSIDTLDDKITEIMDNLMDGKHFYAAYLWIASALERKKIDQDVFNELGKEVLQREMTFWKEKNISFLELHALQDLVHQFPEEQTKDNLTLMLKLKEKMKIKPRRIN